MTSKEEPKKNLDSKDIWGGADVSILIFRKNLQRYKDGLMKKSHLNSRYFRTTLNR